MNAVDEQRQSREWVRTMAKEMRAAMAAERCYITPDGWCSTHSTSDGPVYCGG